MLTATITAKGQLTLPADIRRALGVKPGDRLRFVADGRGYRLVVASASIESVKDIVPKPEKPVTLEEMEAAFALASEVRPLA